MGGNICALILDFQPGDLQVFELGFYDLAETASGAALPAGVVVVVVIVTGCKVARW